MFFHSLTGKMAESLKRRGDIRPRLAHGLAVDQHIASITTYK